MFKFYWKLDRESKQTEMGEPENPTQYTDDDITHNTPGNHSLNNTETQMENCYNNNEDFNIEDADHEFQSSLPRTHRHSNNKKLRRLRKKTTSHCKT
jgi:hypothetical protein